jgi:hypothetical protein
MAGLIALFGTARDYTLFTLHCHTRISVDTDDLIAVV